LKSKIKAIKQARARWRELDGENEEQRQLVVNLRIQSSALSKALDELKHANKTAVHDIDVLRDDVDDTKVDADSATFMLKSVTSILRDLQEEAGELKLHLKKEISLGDNLEGENIALDLESDGIQERKTKEAEAVEKLEEMKEELKKENAELLAKIEEEKRSYESWVNERAKTRTSLIEAKAHVEASKTRMAQLEDVMRGKESQQKKVSKHLEPLENKKVYGPPREFKLEAKLKKYQAILPQTEERATTATAELKRAKTEYLRLQETVAELRDEFSTIKKRIRQARDPRRRFADRLVSMSGTLKWTVK